MGKAMNKLPPDRRTAPILDDRDVMVGDLVIVKTKNCPRNVWPTAVIEAVGISLDGFVRSCQVRTSKGTYRRAVYDPILLVPVQAGV